MRPISKIFRLRVLLASCALAAAVHAHGAESFSSLTPEIRREILDCTFEVISIMRDADGRPSRWLVGTAYCIGDGTLATAAHVFDQTLGGRYDAPVLRDRRGRIYPVDRVLRYSMPDDFVVFTATGLETRRAPHTNTSGEVTNRLYVASRRADGELALMETRFRGRTTAATYGHDGWIQFGPAPGHGSSGGALLDEQGHLVGIIRSRSSERDDAIAFAIPIAHIEAASTSKGTLRMDDPLTVLDMPSNQNLSLQSDVTLPASYTRFAHDQVQAREAYFAYLLPFSLSLEGNDAVLSDEQRKRLCVALGDAYCEQNVRGGLIEVASRERGAPEHPARGCDIAWVGVGAALIRCANMRAQAEAAVLGREALQREDATCPLSEPLDWTAREELFADPAGAIWRIRSWPVRACDSTIVTMSRRTLDGMLTLVRGAPSGYATVAIQQLKALTNLRCASCASAPTPDASGPSPSVTDHPWTATRKHSAAIGTSSSAGLLSR